MTIRNTTDFEDASERRLFLASDEMSADTERVDFMLLLVQRHDRLLVYVVRRHDRQGTDPIQRIAENHIVIATAVSKKACTLSASKQTLVLSESTDALHIHCCNH